MLGFWIVLCHLAGDYLLQSHWMATEKTKRLWPAIVHGVTYTLPFLFLTQSWVALAVICGTHIVIDRYRLAKHFTWFKNLFAPKAYRAGHTETGYPDSAPVWLTMWLMIIVDNTIHLAINALAILYM